MDLRDAFQFHCSSTTKEYYFLLLTEICKTHRVLSRVVIAIMASQLNELFIRRCVITSLAIKNASRGGGLIVN
jgi:hypothetical protein